MINYSEVFQNNPLQAFPLKYHVVCLFLILFELYLLLNSNYLKTAKEQLILMVHASHCLIYQLQLFLRVTPRISEDRFTCIVSCYSAKTAQMRFSRRNSPDML